MTDLYQETIIEEYKHPRNKGRISNPDLKIDGSNASCGDSVTIDLKIDSETKQITDIAWEGHGCAVSQAAMSVLSQKIKQEELTLEEVSKIRQQDLLELLGLEEINPGREKCLMMGLTLLQQERKNK